MTEAQAAEWISEHMTALYGYAFARLYNKSDVDDLVSEIICALLSSARRLRDDGAFHGFVWRTAENTFRKFIRRAARDGETWADDGGPNGVYAPSAEDAYMEGEEKDRMLFLLRRELALLSKTHREICLAYYADRKSCSRIAEEQGISVEMVKYHLFKTRRLLKEGIGMNRELGEKSYNPGVFRLDFWGDRNCYGGLFQRKLPGSIMLAAYYVPMTAEELSVELGVSMPYLEEELAILASAGLLQCTGGKYQTNLVILTDEYEKEFVHNTADVYSAAKDGLYEAVKKLLPRVRTLDFRGRDYDDNRLLFALLNIALVNGRPQMLPMRDLIKYFIEHRHDVVVRRTRFDKRKAEERLHIVQGLLIAQDNIDEIVRIIRASQTPDAAKQTMIERFELSDIQASAIIEMRLRALTGLERGKLLAERDELEKLIAHLTEVLANVGMQMQIIKDELLEIKEKYGDERRSEIVYASEEFNPEDFYADDDMVITISHMGYIKRTPLAEYRTQNRGGVGAKGSATRDEDFIEHIYVASMHNTMLFFTEKGRCFWLKVYEIPEGARSSKGRAIQNVIQIEPDDKVRAYINVKSLADAEYVNNNYIIMCTKDGTIKKTKLEAYSRPRQNGVNAIVIREGDQLIEAKLTSGNAEVMIAARDGKAIRFNESTVRPIGRVGAGVRGISIEDGDEVVGMICVEPDSKQDVLVLSENGYGKRTDLDEYRITNRGGKGVKTINITEKTGKLISIQAVTDDNDLMIINRSGLTIRTAVSQIRLAGRATQGVRIINLREGDAIASVMAVPAAGEEEEVQPAEGVETGGETPGAAPAEE